MVSDVSPAGNSTEGVLMLVLSRKVGERVLLGSDIVVEVVSVKGNQVRPGFQAPEDVVIRRQEICFERCEDGHQSKGGPAQADVLVSA
jgi:carbon storage regulator